MGGGGEGGIRTLEAGISRLRDFQSRSFGQLGHLSVRTSFTKKRFQRACQTSPVRRHRNSGSHRTRRGPRRGSKARRCPHAFERRRVAEREGFEPSVRFYPYNRLAGGCLQPARPPLRTNTFTNILPCFADALQRTPRIPPATKGTLRSARFPFLRHQPCAKEGGGGSRIRTCGASPPSGFQDRRLQPLGHPSTKRILIPDPVATREGKRGPGRHRTRMV